MKAVVLLFWGMIKQLDGLDILYFVGTITTTAGILLEYGLNYGLIFLGAALMAIPLLNLVMNREQ